MSIRPRARSRRRRRGQSLVEFALLVPVLLILVLGALDLGRAFFTWVTLNNSALVAANYAAANPNGPFTGGSTYVSDVNQEGLSALSSICPPVGTQPPAPAFADTSVDGNTTTKDLGDTATVTISCSFHLMTPLIQAIVGNNLQLSASSTFTIRVGTYQP